MQSIKPTERWIDGILLLSLGVSAAVAAADDRLPFILAWPIETTVFLGAFITMTVWKRNPWGWLWTAYAALVCFTNLVLAVIPGGWRANDLIAVMGGLLAIGWWVMILMPSRRDDPAPQVTHILHHHILHGLGGAEAAIGHQTAIPGEVVTGSRPAPLPAARRLAITAPRVLEDLTREPGKTAAAVLTRVLRTAKDKANKSR